jgi:hypothetical protein
MTFLDQDAIPDILQSYLLATSLDRTWYKAWHAWALANSEVVAHFAKTQPEHEAMPAQVFTDHLVPAVQGPSRFLHRSPTTADALVNSFLPICRAVAWKLTTRYTAIANVVVQVWTVGRSHSRYYGRFPKCLS